MENYKSLTEFLNKGRNENYRRIANNTYVEKKDNLISIRLHETKIITYYSDGKIKLNSGGWKTVTTKQRLNNFTNFAIYQEKSTWYFCITNNEKENRYYFKDNMEIDKAGKITGTELVSPEKEKENNKLVKQVNIYTKKYIKAFINNEIKKPSSKDCLYCRANLPGNNHILLHMQENYFVPSLLKNAIELKPVSIIVNDLIYNTWINNKIINKEDDKWIISIFEFQVLSSLRKYIKYNLGLAS